MLEAASVMELDETLGPQNPGDGPLLRRLRLHQSWYRAKVLRRPDWGSTQGVASRELGSVLSEDDAAAGLNFVSSSAFGLYTARRAAGWGVDPRCTAHMTSSQALTINLIGLLSESEAWLLDCLNAWLRRSDLRAVAHIEIEFAPARRSLHLNDQTRIDALLVVKGSDGQEIIAVEIKYADRFNSRRVDIATRPYRDLAKRTGLWTTPSNILDDQRVNQLVRVHALATSYAQSMGIGRPASLIVATHESDAVAREVVNAYKAQVNGPLVAHTALRSVCTSVVDTAPSSRRGTAELLYSRYGCEDGSDGLSGSPSVRPHRSGDRVA